MRKILFIKNQKLPSTFDEQMEMFLKNGASKLDDVPNKFDSGLICVVKNGDESIVSSFQDRKEFNQFRNILLRCRNSRESVTWLKLPKI